jgi:hypothetical protein
MSRLRMFHDDEPTESPSPRTTIVGGRPPEDGAALPPVPTGLPRLLRLAAVDEAFRGELLARRAAVAAAAGVTLTPSERAIVDAVPAAHLAAMIAGLPPPAPDRREFLVRAAASAVLLLLGGASLGSGCERPRRNEALTEGGISPVLREPRREAAQTAGAAPDLPPMAPVDDGGARPQRNETMRKGGISPQLREPRRREVPGGPVDDPSVPIGGLTAEPPADRAQHRLQAPGGAAPDVPRPPPPPSPPKDGGPR